MNITMLQAKLHRACVTHVELDYEGSCAIDRELLTAAGIRPYQQIDIYNVNNGSRLTTYAIAAEAGSRVISVNGAAAHHANVDDRIIICAYANLTEQEASSFKPVLVYLDEQNFITNVRNAIPVQVA